MPLDPAVADQLTVDALSDHRQSQKLTAMADRSVTQGLAVIMNTLIQQSGGVADDAALNAALNAADRVPALKS